MAIRRTSLVVARQPSRGHRGDRGSYTWALSRNGMGNSYYAAAVKSASVSWKAFFFGALDPGLVHHRRQATRLLLDPALSARLFGFSSWSILLPQALAGVASVLILYRLVRRWQGDIAALLASLALALTPVALVIFRLNNPDAFLTLLLLPAAWLLWSALESGSYLEAGRCRRPGRARLPHQDARGAHRAADVRSRVTWSADLRISAAAC